MAGRRVDEIDVGLPRSLVAERVAVGLDEAIDEIDVRNRVAHPADVVAVELLQVAALIIGDQGGDVLLLRALGYRLGLLEPVDHTLDSRRVHAADAPRTLAERPRGGILHQLRVQTVGDRLGIVAGSGGHPGIEGLGLGLVHPRVVVARRGEQQVLAVRLVEPRRIERRVEDRPANISPQGVQLAEALLGNRLDDVEQVALRELGAELVVRIVVVDAVGEPHLLEVFLERLPLGGRAVAGVVLIDDLQRPPDRKVHAAVLVVENIPAALGSLGQVVDELLLAKGKLVESGHFVADDLDVVETIDDPRCVGPGGVAARGQRGNSACHGCNGNYTFHVFGLYVPPKIRKKRSSPTRPGRALALFSLFFFVLSGVISTFAPQSFQAQG